MGFGIGSLLTCPQINEYYGRRKGVTQPQAKRQHSLVSIRTVETTARAIDPERLDPVRLASLTLTTRDGRAVPVSQIGQVQVEMEAPFLVRCDREPTIIVRGDIEEGLQPPDITAHVLSKFKPIIAGLPAGYRIDTSGSVEESGRWCSPRLRRCWPSFPSRSRPSGGLAFILIGGVVVGTALTLLFLPVLYAMFFRVPLRRPYGRRRGDPWA